MSNTIEGLKYKAIEKDLYEKELMDKDKSMQVWGEILSIKLSKLSNNHGQNWLKAVLFTFVSGFIFLTFSIKPLFFIQSLYILLPISVIAFLCKDIYKYLLNTVLIYIILFWFTPFLYEIVCSNQLLYIDNFFPYLMPTIFNPISSFNITTNNERLISYATYFMGKIAIGYGIVEIVQAFRKLNSK